MVKTIKMTKKDLVKEHKRITKLLSDSISLIELIDEQSLSKSQQNKLFKVYNRLKSEYEDQIQELNDYKSR